MNVIHLIGNLGAAPDPISTATNPVAKVSLATSESYIKKGETDRTVDTTWHTIFFYGKTAESAIKYLKKGSKIAVTGMLKSNKYKDETGKDRTGYFIRGERFEFLDKLPSSSESTTTTDTAPNTTAANAKNQTPAYQTKSDVPPAPVLPTKKEPLAATVVHTEADLTFTDDQGNDDLPF